MVISFQSCILFLYDRDQQDRNVLHLWVIQSPQLLNCAAAASELL